MTDTDLWNVRDEAHAARQATAHRDAAIRAARDSGATLRQLARVTQLSHQTIANICTRDNDQETPE